MIQKLFKRNSSGKIAFLFGAFLFMATGTGWTQVTLGAREIAMGRATTALTGSEWAVFANPALADLHTGKASFFGIRYYGLAEITDIAVAVTYPTRMGAFGGGVHRYGDELFSESRFRVSYNNSWQGFYYGMALNYNHVSIGNGYGSAGALGIDLGLAATLTEGLWIGAKTTNINQPAYDSGEEELPRDLSLGLSYQLSDGALFTSDIVKDVRFPVSYRGGVEVRIIEHLNARAGITTKPVTFAMGFGYNTPAWGVNIAVQRHENPRLGLSPGLDFNIGW